MPQPPDPSIKIWRYVDLARLISLLDAQHLIMTRADLLGDDFEGSVTRAVYERFKANPNFAMLQAHRPEFTRGVYVSSWHANDQESEAMWRLYCRDREGVALQTTYRKLDASLPDSIMLGMVTYVDYDVDDLPGWNMLTPLMHKRRSFAHEQEVRALVWRASKLLAEGVPIEQLPTDQAPAIGVAWDIVATIDRVYVSPYAPEWYRNVIETVLRRFQPALADRLTWSQMKGTPLY